MKLVDFSPVVKSVSKQVFMFVFFSYCALHAYAQNESEEEKQLKAKQLVENYRNLNTLDEGVDAAEKWFFARIDSKLDDLDRQATAYLKEEFQNTIGKKVETKIKALFNDKVLPELEERAVKYLGEEVVEKVFKGEITREIFSGIPYMSFFSAALTSGGESETAMMLRILLETIEEAKNEIILSVEEGFQDETESRLNALILGFDLFSTRGDAYQWLLLNELTDYSNDSIYVKKRFEQKDQRAIDNLHLYFLASSLQIEIEKQKTRLLVETANPNFTKAQIEQEYNKEISAIMNAIVNDMVEYVVLNPAIASLDNWRAAYEDAFGSGDDVDYIGENIFAYYLNDNPVLFKVHRGASLGSRLFFLCNYSVDSPLGVPLSSFRANCSASYESLLPEVKGHATVLMNRHKQDQASFDTYLFEGYEPVQDIIDSWWDFAKSGSRPLSEVDNYLANIPGEYALSCEKSGLNGTMVLSVSGFGSSTTLAAAQESCGPCSVTKRTVAGRVPKSQYFCALP